MHTTKVVFILLVFIYLCFNFFVCTLIHLLHYINLRVIDTSLVSLQVKILHTKQDCSLFKVQFFEKLSNNT